VERVLDEPPKAQLERRFLKYTFFKVAREWRSLEEESKEKARHEFLSVLEKHSPEVRPSCFSLVGIRGDTDFMVLAESKDLDSFQFLVSHLLATRLGRYLEMPYSYLAMTRSSPYLSTHRNLGQKDFDGGLHQQSKYLFVYPFTKKREWYRIPFTERQMMMAEHFKVGHKYPRIKINTGYSFGLDDQEFVLAFEGDDPSEFLTLVEELRGSEASMYTQLEIPIFTCIRVDAKRMLELLS
jgi:chlorite dismutase